MIIDTSSWEWSQWFIVAWLFLSCLAASVMHNKEMVERTGPEKGQPLRRNAFERIVNRSIIAFALIAGGFFQ